jgi:uncharacterized protein YjiS (DUF1127 family)
MIAAGQPSNTYLARASQSRNSGPSLLVRLVDTVFAWHERAHSRRMLAGLDNRMLRDIGISSGVAAEEADKPFWRP